MRNCPLVMPIEFVVEKGRKTVAYIPLLQVLQKLLNKEDVLDEAMSKQERKPHEYKTCSNGSSFRKNALLSCDEFTIALGRYIDDFELANPLGTFKRKHKMCALYWVIVNLHGKYRSTLNSIKLALLCNTETVKECGYKRVLYPLLCDLATLEQHGVYIEHLGRSVKGMVLYVSADNSSAHFLAGFYESFTVDCRFCMASRTDVQHQEVGSGAFQLTERYTQQAGARIIAGSNFRKKHRCEKTMPTYSKSDFMSLADMLLTYCLMSLRE